MAKLRVDAVDDKFGPALMIDELDPNKPAFRSAMPSAEIAADLLRCVNAVRELRSIVGQDGHNQNMLGIRVRSLVERLPDL